MGLAEKLESIASVRNSPESRAFELRWGNWQAIVLIVGAGGLALNSYNLIVLSCILYLITSLIISVSKLLWAVTTTLIFTVSCISVITAYTFFQYLQNSGALTPEVPLVFVRDWSSWVPTMIVWQGIFGNIFGSMGQSSRLVEYINRYGEIR
jgi:hypothetical protein